MKEKITTISIAVIALSLIVLVVLEFTGGDEAASSPAAVNVPVNPADRTPLSQSSISGDGQPELLMDAIPSNVDPVDVTSISFEESIKDLGTMKAGAKVQHIFNFVNTGNIPLILSGVNVDPGCRLVESPEEPIPAGGGGKIIIEFDSEGMSGTVSKTIHVNANTDPSHQHITLTAIVN